jgi:hypothetical protein
LRLRQSKTAVGSLRDLMRRAAKYEFSLGPMLTALFRANDGAEARAV